MPAFQGLSTFSAGPTGSAALGSSAASPAPAAPAGASPPLARVESCRTRTGFTEPDRQRSGWSPTTNGRPMTRQVTVTGRIASRGTLERFFFSSWFFWFFSLFTRDSRFLTRAWL